MAGHSILYLGRGEFAPEYLSELETLPCCTMLVRAGGYDLPAELPSLIDVVMIETGPAIVGSGHSLGGLLHAVKGFPVIALTRKATEHRGIAAVQAGAQAYICIDDITVDEQDAVIDHAVKRYGLQQRLSDTDVTVLSILKNINDGVVVVNSEGHILDINPAARSILGLGPRQLPDPAI